MTLSNKIYIDLGENEFKVIGPQLNSAEPVELKIRYRGDDGPARFIFLGESIDAHIDNITDAKERGLTTIGNHKIKIRQIEHVLSALFGMGCLSSDLELSYLNKKITDKTISPPVCHINAEEYVLGIKRSFRKKEFNYIDIGHPIAIRENKPSNPRDPSYAIFTPLNAFHVTVSINFPYFWGRQKFSCNLSKYGVYEQQVAWARSFFSSPYPHRQEWKLLKRKFPALINERMKHAQSIMIDYTQDKWITHLYSEDEPVRHKLLDFLGDMALIGSHLHAGIFVYKPHHKFNRQCVRAVVDALKK
jgi:UDP-3-O-acyl-N-acetylglucosamine deacetylase